ncbi:hypothetical protein ACO0QE_000749 [Hanseniaspora vineae]
MLKMRESSGHNTSESKIANKLWNNNNTTTDNTTSNSRRRRSSISSGAGGSCSSNNKSHLSIKKLVDDIQHMSILNGHKNDSRDDIDKVDTSRLTLKSIKPSVSQDSAMYGRKGSVSLRIFHNDEDTNNNDQLETSSGMITEGGSHKTSIPSHRSSIYEKKTSTSVDPTLQHQTKSPKSLIKESYSVKLKSPLYHAFTENESAIDDDDNEEDTGELVAKNIKQVSDSSRGKKILVEKTSLGKTPMGKRLLSRDYLFDEPDEGNVVKRVSSATYIPHTVPAIIGGTKDSGKSLLSNESFAKTLGTGDLVATSNNQNIISGNKEIRLVGEKLPIMSDKKDNAAVQKAAGIEVKNTGKNKDEDQQEDEQYEFPLAVELKPFKNKVGGHTEIFKFSKRAVCKTLVNNENVWYENLEHLYATKEANEQKMSNGETHKESHNILHYMPKYIGVLNVRQHFNTLDEYMEAVGEVNTAKQVKEKQESQEQSAKNSHKTIKKKPRCNSDTINEVVLDDNIHLFPSSFLNKINHIFTNTGNQSTPTTSPVYGTSRSLMERRLSNQDFSSSPLNKQNRSNSSSNNNNNNNNNSLLSSSPSSTHSLSLMNSNPAEQIEMPKLQHSQSQSIIDDHFINTTMINTKLQEQVINEVFAPYKCSNMSYHNNNNNLTNNNVHLYDSPRSNSRSNSNTMGSLRNLSSPSLSARRRRQSDSTSFGSKRYSHNVKQTITPPLKSKQSDCSNEEALMMSDELTLLPEPSLTEKYSNENHNSKIEYQNSTQQHDVFQMNKSEDNATPQNDHPLHSPQGDYTVVSQFILLEDLTRNLENPCVLDLKMGTRQYGVMANVRKQKSQSLKCLKTTSKKLGCRVCGLKIWDPQSKTYLKKDKYFGRRIRIGWQFSRVLARFLYNKQTITSILVKIPKLVKNLDNLNETIKFLKGYRLYGASLLFMYDGSNELSNCKIYLIDFAQCLIRQDFVSKIDSMECPPKTSIQWEDKGFCKGLKSLKFYLKAIWNHLTSNHELIYDDQELLQYLTANKATFQKNWSWLDEFDVEDEAEFNDEDSKLRKKWMKDELLFDVEPPFENSEESS